ncbi:chromosome segregation protein SMC [Bombilactobacillus bombi]|uniref:Chromosome partition protein Smc n=1 Tax=Bombilactobacillus bombi TaxID=1303590 RepID=A0A417ZCC5_9LACO|nr:chromosome segregation protein SMC [Bombilactobacillus bombi]
MFLALKSLQISGFKSFADSITVHFDQGITGIVGPNGSGKSNLTEALRWVMGEQSAKSLRGGKMEDIIFAGSDSRPPLNRAEVILKFDNHDRQLNIDRDEVEIRRRLFRGGESECLLNNQKVRLKDIVDLFLDSGLGKNSFSIISQGNVEKIFNSKPVDRRFIIEEPAGVASFKIKKQQAQQQLQQTDDNLQRVSDIVHELSRQVEPLKRQASIAHDYQEQKQKYDRLEQLILADEIHTLNQQEQKWQTQKQEAKNQLNQISQQVSQSDEKISKLQKLNQELTSEIDTKQTELTNLSRQLEVLNGQQALAKERSGFNETNHSTLVSQQAQLQQKLLEVKETLQHQQQQKQDLEQQVQELKQEIANIQADFNLDPQQINQKIADLQADYLEMLQQQTSLHNQQNYLHNQLKQLQQQQEEYHQQQLLLEQQQQELEHQIKQLEQDQQQAQLQYQQQQKIDQQAQHQRQQAQQELQKVQQKYNQSLQIWQQHQAEYHSLNKIVQQHQGFYQGVRAILNQKQALSGIIGVIAELITVPEKYQIAIQNAVGAQLQSIVTETETDARDAINFLRKNRAGRATFLPQTVIKSHKIANSSIQDLRQASYFMGIASDLITYQPKLANIMENIFGSLLVVTDIDAAIKASNLTAHRFRIVTLKGDIISPGGAMTGGQSKNNIDLLSQRTKVSKLEQWLQQAQSQLQEQQQNIKQRQEQEKKLTEQIKQTHEQSRLLESKIQHLQNNLQLKQQAYKSNQQQLTAREFQIKQVQKQIQDLQDQTQTNKNSNQIISEKIEQQQQQVAQNKALLTDFDAQKQVFESRLHTYKTQLALAENNLQNQQQQQQDSQAQLSQLQKQIKQVEAKLLQLSQDKQGLSLSTLDMQQKISENQTAIANLKTSLKAIQQQRNQINEQMQKLQQQATRLFDLQKNWTDQQEDIAINLTNITNQIKQKLTILEQEYHLSFEAAYQRISTDWQLTAAQEQAKLLKKGIQELGEVNLSSIKEYDQVKDRYEFLTKQQNDLLQARQQLQNTMKEMDQEVAQRFEKTFNQIAATFEVIFPKMFGGGHAQLVLDDPSNMLETGIEIVAQPPGKKLQRLSLLSGGERALTAITLLFSILKVRPVAFCVLDEVEASLDDANVERFANYLNKYDDQTQFIVITHRKGTMMHVNRLYGVSMQESGISSIITVKLEQQKDEA